MIKLLSIFSILLVSSVLFAQECGKSEVQTETLVSSQLVNTETPKFLQGATITITKADGSSETVKAEEFMVVRRKHLRPVVNVLNTETKKVCTNNVPEDQKYSKNILSLKVADGYSDVQSEQTSSGSKLSVDRLISAGVQYQRAYNNKFYFGVGADTNQGAEVLMGIGF